MEKKKTGFGAMLFNAGNKAKDTIGKAKEMTSQLIDRNGDGKPDFEDVSVVADNFGNALKKGAAAIKTAAAEKAKLLEERSLHPIFKDLLEDSTFRMPKLIRITERDKKYADSELCEGSIGYLSESKGESVVNIFRDSVEAFGLKFFPQIECTAFYLDPTKEGEYIALDDFFPRLKVARINELQRIAQELGAKHFKVTYREEQSSSSEVEAKINAKIPSNYGNAALNHSSEKEKQETIEIAAEMEFPGRAPVRPILRYMKNDPSIQSLIEMRMDASSPLLHQKYMLKMSNSSGVSMNEAIKIDLILSELKIPVNVAIALEAKNESLRFLEYEIDF